MAVRRWPAAEDCLIRILYVAAIGVLLSPLGGCSGFLSNDLSLDSAAMRNTEAQAFSGSPVAGSNAAMPAKAGDQR